MRLHVASLLTLVSVACVAASNTPTSAEILAASTELQNGRLSVDNLALFERAVDASPADWRAHAMLGQALSHDRDRDGALASLSRAHVLAPHVGPVALLLANEPP